MSMRTISVILGILLCAVVSSVALSEELKTVKGKVTAIDYEAKTITVGDQKIYAPNVEFGVELVGRKLLESGRPSEIEFGDDVVITYEATEDGKQVLRNLKNNSRGNQRNSTTSVQNTKLLDRISAEIKKGYKVCFGCWIGEYDDLVIDIRSSDRVGATTSFSCEEISLGDGNTLLSDPNDPLTLETVLVNLKSGPTTFPRRKSGKGLVISEKYSQIWVLGFVPFSTGDIVYSRNDSLLRKNPSLDSQDVTRLNKGQPVEVMEVRNRFVRVKAKEVEGWVHISGISLTR